MRLTALTSSLLFLLLPATGVYADANAGLYPPGLQPLITRANVLLSSGQFSEAAKVYSEAIEQSPADYLLFYKRGTAYLSLGRHGAALDDFTHVLSLTPLPSAYLMQARIHTKDGEFALARTALSHYTGGSKEQQEKDSLLEDIATAEAAAKQATQERAAQLWTACTESASRALRTSTHSVAVRSLRVECALGAGDVEGGVADMSRLANLLPEAQTAPMHALTWRLSFFLQEPGPVGANALKACLHGDPESKVCLPLHRVAKALERGFTLVDEQQAKGDWRAAMATLKGPGKKADLFKRFEEAATEQLVSEHLTLFGLGKGGASIPDWRKVSPRRRTLLRGLCKAHTQLEIFKKGEEWCRMLLEMEDGDGDADALRGLGEAALAKEDWEEAVRLLEKAFEATGRGDRDFGARLQKAQRLLKQSRAKDYYKVLGVSRDADERTIKKAFRTAAKSAHPDKGGSEAKMAALNEAYEVLSNPELRQRFDNGEDPNDPMAQQGGHPFQQGGHPFSQFFQGGSGGGFPGGGGGFQFHFQHGR
ncbi:hypothetical protein FB45DRAFT_918432 [Roridomyces roridus]|uniref:J domain-containing protein n=1 Tax=Roridomyces roridus TaxID=1738132 RepID=A0AAD7BR45_9AGAR|nr:hypothetical protein FB45DRAFT_918432 [Roridomyces roridus]